MTAKEELLSYCESAIKVIGTEMVGLGAMMENLTRESMPFAKSVEAILNCRGRVVISGMGKSGHIGTKIAASLASTGTPAFFMHPGEAFHGDLGMVTKDDIFIAISNSGSSDEVLKLIPYLRDNGNVIISMCGKKDSPLAEASNFVLDISVPEEACPHQLAPTTSTTATLVMGDCLTVALLEARSFQPEDFARFHPGGALGKKLLHKAKDAMSDKKIPHISAESSFTTVVDAVSSGRLGLTLVYGGSEGIITDGDIRRTLEEYGEASFKLLAGDIMTVDPKVCYAHQRVADVYEEMTELKITSILVKEDDKIIGILRK